MTAPNIINAVNITGKTTGYAITTTLASFLTNSSGSNKVYKVNSLLISNINGTNSAKANVSIYKNQTTDYYLGDEITVPAGSTLVLLSKDTGVYLEENDSLRASATVNSYLHAIVSYEDIS